MKKYRHTVNVLLLVFLLMMMIFLGVAMFWEGVGLEFRHYISLIFTAIVFSALFVNQNAFTLLLGLTLAIGNFGGLSSLPEIAIYSSHINIGPIAIPLYWGQPLYSILLLIYIVFNKEFYIGIITKEYWKDFLHRTKDLEQVIVTIPNNNHQEEKESEQVDQ